MSNSSSPAIVSPVYSEFADDPDFCDLLGMFLESLNERRSELDSLFQKRQWDTLGQVAHQIKGAGGGYGFPGLTRKASGLEEAVKRANQDEIAYVMQELFAYMDRLCV